MIFHLVTFERKTSRLSSSFFCSAEMSDVLNSTSWSTRCPFPPFFTIHYTFFFIGNKIIVDSILILITLPRSRFLDVTQRSPKRTRSFVGALRDIQKTAATETRSSSFVPVLFHSFPPPSPYSVYFSVYTGKRTSTLRK